MSHSYSNADGMRSLKVVRVVVDSMIRIPVSEIHPKVLEQFRRELSFPNPEYVKRRRLGYYVGNTSERIECLIEQPDGWMEITRGAVGILRQRMFEAGIQLYFDDCRHVLPCIDLHADIDLRPYQRKAVHSMRTSIQGYVVAPCGSGKCVSSDSLIFTDKGLVTAGELARGVPKKQVAFGEINVDTSTDSALCNAVYNGGQSETRTIRLALGYTLEVTPEHRVRVLRKGELIWKRADELCKGDRVMVRRGSDVWGASNEDHSDQDLNSESIQMFSSTMCLDELTAEVCGLIINKGDLSHGSRVLFHNINEDNVDTVNRWAKAFRQKPKRVPQKRSSAYIIHSAVIREFLSWLGLTDVESAQARIPHRIRQSSPEIMQAFLRGLFDSDGAVNLRRCVVKIESSSRRLLEEVQIALLGLGILSSRYPRHIDDQTCWRLTVYDVESFSELIGVSSKSNQIQLKEAVRRVRARRHNPNVDTLPVNGLLKTLSDAVVQSQSLLLNEKDELFFQKFVPGRRAPSRIALNLLIQHWKQEFPAECESIARLLDLPAVFLPVQLVEKSEADVVDLCVPDIHEFVANGVVCHNTVIGTAAIAEIQQPSLVIVHTKDLLEQWRAAIRGILNVEAGIVAEGKCSPDVITVATVQTLIRHPYLDDLATRFGCVIVDEAHYSPAATFQSVLSHFPARYRFGLTATPYREDGLTRLIDFTLGERLYEIEHWKLILNGYLQRPEVRKVQTEFAFTFNSGEYDHNRCMASLVTDPDRNAQIADIAANEAVCGHCVLILSNRVKHCRHLAELIQERGVSVEVLVGAVKKADRQAILDDFRAGELSVVVASTLADEGLDVPRLDRIVLSYPSRAKGRTIQRLGRLMRPHPDKQQAVLFDVVDKNVKPLVRQYQERSRFYRSLGLDEIQTSSME
ncbi:MAG: DEAD/DEAH box helicase family protein [Proteobacteria bacterium]|nr:DEAD/DEAH box helicase family protein [Pseudomonadota bacterium]